MSYKNTHPKETKLSFEIAETIRKTYKLNPKATYRNLAKQYKVSKTLISKIINNKIYKPEAYLEEGEQFEEQDFTG